MIDNDVESEVVSAEVGDDASGAVRPERGVEVAVRQVTRHGKVVVAGRIHFGLADRAIFRAKAIGAVSVGEESALQMGVAEKSEWR